MTAAAAPPHPADPAPPLGRGPAALVGVLGVGVAVGVGHLVGGLVSPASSPFNAVADAAVRLAPPWLVELGKQLGPTTDKLALQLVVAVGLVVVAVVAGLVSRRGPGPGKAVIAVLGLVGLTAVATAPAFAPLDLLAPVLAATAGLVVFSALHALARRAARPDAGPAPDAGGVTRRTVLVGSSAAFGVGALTAGIGALGAGVVGQVLAAGSDDSRAEVTRRLAAARITPAPPIPAGADFAALGTPTFLTTNPDFYRVDTALRIPTVNAADWSVRVHGMVDRELTLTFDDLFRRPLVERTITMTCVSNEVGGRYISTANFVGVELRPILLEAGVRPGADQLLSTGADGGWTAGTPTAVLLEPDRGALLGVGMNGEALPPEHGFPVRMVVPGLYGFVSATKWLTDLELTTFAQAQAYWRERGWGTLAPIKTQSRIDYPKPFATVPAGRVPVAGIAWSQPTGISRVEIRADGGVWSEAELSTEVSGDTWRMWKIDLDLGPGSHAVQVRATDRDGVVQPEERAEPIPDGATGWHSTMFTVA